MKAVNATSFRHIVAEQLREAIASGDLAPGERLGEVDVAKRLGVSPTPVREAFRDLEQAGLIEVVPYRGARVKPVTQKDLAEMYSLRAHLEQMAIKLAFPHLTGDDFEQLADHIRSMEQRAIADDLTGVVENDVAFHRHILLRANHDLLLKTWEDINPYRWTYVTVHVLAARGPLYIAQRHWPFLDVLKGTSLDAAMAAAGEHIEYVGDEAIRTVIESEPEADAPADGKSDVIEPERKQK